MARSGLLERERQRLAGVLRITYADSDLLMDGHARLSDHDHRACRAGGGVPAHRAEDHGCEPACPAGADHQHGGIRAAVRHGQGWRARQQVGGDLQAPGHLLSPGDSSLKGALGHAP